MLCFQIFRHPAAMWGADQWERSTVVVTHSQQGRWKTHSDEHTGINSNTQGHTGINRNTQEYTLTHKDTQYHIGPHRKTQKQPRTQKDTASMRRGKVPEVGLLLLAYQLCSRWGGGQLEATAAGSTKLCRPLVKKLEQYVLHYVDILWGYCIV